MNPTAELRGVLDRIAGRFRRVRLWSGLAVGWGLLAAVGLVAAVTSGANRELAFAVALTAVAVGAVWWVVSRQTARDPRWVAGRIEERHPDLAALLRTAVEQQPAADGRVGFLQASVLESAVAHSRTHDWDDTVPRRRLVASGTATVLTFALLAGVVGWLSFQAAGGDPFSFNTAGVDATATDTGVTVEPGDTQLERGSPLLVTAHFTGTVPAEAVLVADGTAPRPMTRTLDDPKFAGYLPAVGTDLTYRVEFTGGRSDTFRVTVYEHPELVRVNARLVFPSFANTDPKTVEDVRRVTAVEGTAITLFCQLNKAVPRAVLVDEKTQELPLVVHDAEKHIYTVTVKPTETQRYRVRLADADGRANKLPSDIAVQITRNLPPVVAVPRPGRDARVSPIEELPLKADIEDDFGVVRHGVSVTMAGKPPVEVVLGEAKAAPPKRVQPDHLIDFEALKAQPDQVASYHFWAEDVGPDGRPRRTSGDLFFAEVRHFEEIFRQGEQQTREQQEREQQERQQGESPAAQAADQLAEMQKQIVNATWRLIRRETGGKPTDKFADDVKLVRESQQAVIEKAGAVAERLQGASAEDLKQAVTFMEGAVKQLGEAEEKASPQVLPTALSSEQAAYQALLKLRAREFNVTRNNNRNNSRSQANNSRSPSQQQLRQLDLTDERQRYETQTAARAQREQQAQRDREQRENQELADKLKELARRQSDLTDRVKELQSALEQAKDDTKKEELQQQLKRLREQQQQMLRDTEEVQERLEGEQNRERLADARRQVEQSRENQQKASDALEKGQLGQAVNEGTRAQRQLDAVRDQLRRESANKFGEEMKDLRQQARQLDDKQKELTRQLEEGQKPKPGLNGGADRDQIKKGLEEQKEKLDKITERAQKTVEDAEKSEPLLAQELYNTVRGAAEQKVGDSLDLARRLTESGRAEATDASRKAAEGTEQLRKGVERAAERVLGGDTDALRRAQKELDELSDQLNREVAQATGKEQPGQGKPNDQKPQQPGQGEQPGQQPQFGQQPGQQPGEGREPGQQPGQGGNQPRRLNDPQAQPGERAQPGGAERGQPTAGRGGPIREDGFRDWFDRMRATEDMLDDPALRAEAARLREKVRTAREEFKRHAREPDWKQLQEGVITPLNELRNKVAEEVRRRESPNSLVPIDRDPVPPDYADRVRRYYERLGSGK